MELIRVSCPLCSCVVSRPERIVAGFGLERCQSCGFVFVNPQPSEAELTQVYAVRDAEQLIELYSRIQNADVEQQQDRILKLLERYMPDRGRLLDFGCGAGYFAERAAKRGWDAAGIDLGEWCREAARRRGFEKVIIGSLAEGVFPPGHFDIITANQVLEHLPNPRAILAQIRDAIRPGGFFYANVPNYRCLSILLGKDDFEHNTPPQHLNYFMPGSLKRLLESSGFHILRASTYGGLKWENLLGRKTKSSITAAYESTAAKQPDLSKTPSKRSLLKRVLRPAIDLPFYRWAKVGIALEAIARRA